MNVLRHRNFRLVWTGQVVSVIGDGMRTIALLWLAKTQSGSNAAVIAVAASTSIPIVLGSPLGGWAADRFDRRRLMLAADLHRGAVSAALAFLLAAGHLTTTWLCALVAVAACGTALFEPTFAAAVPTLVPSDERAAANGLNMANSAGGSLIGPVLGGSLLAAVGAQWVLAIDAASFLWCAALVARSRIPRPVASESTEAAQGATAPRITVRSVLADTTVRRLGGLACVLNLLAAPLTVLLLALAIDHHGVGPRMYGVLGMMLPAGLLAGSLLAGRVAAHRLALIGSLLAVGSTLSIVGLVPLAVLMVVLVAVGASLAVANTVLITTMQDAVAPEVQGRTFGILGGLSVGLRPVGLVAAAPLLAATGVSGSFVVIGLGMVATTLAWARPSRLGPRAVEESGAMVELAAS